jgi:hypothetical protein
MRAAILILAAFAAGCAPLWDYYPRTPLEEEADYQRTHSSYKELAIARVKALNYQGGLATPTISPLRKSHTVAFADWMACVQGEGEGQRRTFAVFYRDRKIADFRHAVVIDGCDSEPYERLQPESGPTPAAAPAPAPAKQASAGQQER